jgi:soluble lytic murein transglycosylase-like protein
MPRTRFTADIIRAATTEGVDPNLVEGIVLTESSGNTDAFRFEPLFWNRYMKGKPGWAGRNPRRVSSSYGLMQVMYPVALERGLDPKLAPEVLFVPDVGLRYGCKQLRWLQDWAETFQAVDAQKRLVCALAAYNGGKGGNAPTDAIPRNEVYARKVLQAVSKLDI